MTNPYASSNQSQSTSNIQRPVRRWVILSFALVFVAVMVSLPALFILNEEQGYYPLTFGLVGMDYGGESISLYVVMIVLFCFASTLLVCAAVCGFTALNNSRWNHRLRHPSKD